MRQIIDLLEEKGESDGTVQEFRSRAETYGLSQ